MMVTAAACACSITNLRSKRLKRFFEHLDLGSAPQNHERDVEATQPQVMVINAPLLGPNDVSADFKLHPVGSKFNLRLLRDGGMILRSGDKTGSMMDDNTP